GQPAIGDLAVEAGVIGLGDLQLLVLGTVVDGRSGERVAVDVEVRTLRRGHVVGDLRIGRDRPGRAALVADLVLDIDAVGAAAEHQRLGDLDALGRGPGERHAQYVEAVREAEAGERRAAL